MWVARTGLLLVLLSLAVRPRVAVLLFGVALDGRTRRPLLADVGRDPVVDGAAAVVDPVAGGVGINNP